MPDGHLKNKRADDKGDGLGSTLYRQNLPTFPHNSSHASTFTTSSGLKICGVYQGLQALGVNHDYDSTFVAGAEVDI